MILGYFHVVFWMDGVSSNNIFRHDVLMKTRP